MNFCVIHYSPQSSLFGAGGDFGHIDTTPVGISASYQATEGTTEWVFKDADDVTVGEAEQKQGEWIAIDNNGKNPFHVARAGNVERAAILFRGGGPFNHFFREFTGI